MNAKPPKYDTTQKRRQRRRRAALLAAAQAAGFESWYALETAVLRGEYQLTPAPLASVRAK